MPGSLPLPTSANQWKVLLLSAISATRFVEGGPPAFARGYGAARRVRRGWFFMRTPGQQRACESVDINLNSAVAASAPRIDDE